MDPAARPTKVDRPSDVTGLVDTGKLVGLLDQADAVAVLESIQRISDRKLGSSLLSSALQGLSERERHIIEERRLTDNPRTLEEIGAEYGISRERVRQIENRAFSKLQKAVLAAMQPHPVFNFQFAICI